MPKRIMIAGTASGVGKTTLTIGIMAALHKRGLTVQGFKCGPDYIDPAYHTAVTNRPSRNLDSYMLDQEMIKSIFVHGQAKADLSIIEGMMGLFDGESPTSNKGSSAEISMITETPIILVVDCYSMARSAAAVVKGFQCFESNTKIVGVVANKVGGEGHFQLVKAAVEQECGISVIGYLSRDQLLDMPERHLGLVPSIERGELDPFLTTLAEAVEETVDLDLLVSLASDQPLNLETASSPFHQKSKEQVRIAVAKDAAFNFYYQENFELLQANGAKLVYFSPLAGELLPEDIDGLYIGGGFPEEFADILSDHREVRESIKNAILDGLPTLAECGGFMFLTESIITSEQKHHEMVGVIPGKVTMQQGLTAIGYREVQGEAGNYLLPPGVKAKGHEYHYSTFEPTGEIPYAYQTKGFFKEDKEGYMNLNLVAGYTHFHFASCPELVENWIEKCKERSND
ncbi:cobyrinic acid a,c-diamide synthase [Bacillus mesophilus]|uniref:Cobyrinate a,c-diamide synthase n=1 Tax=Bacillus mesophilus TaxID=1808955 RepID=A0A6M0QBJ7_9BACI|nr:cobyrinate a,c-diamide synthase [Bacillus mesophilus]MBM7660089.1 cobyrinic acid a,c-diamide synthase [Bacillus mesophilus]NEY73744.1 cobyrinate a,c-diamide synthase [Bacillus mesophilus]